MGAVDVAPEAVLHQFGDAAGMVDMRMRQYHAINFLGFEKPALVEIFHAFLPALVKATVQQNFETIVEREQMGASSHFPGGTTKLDFHRQL